MQPFLLEMTPHPPPFQSFLSRNSSILGSGGITMAQDCALPEEADVSSMWVSIWCHLIHCPIWCLLFAHHPGLPGGSGGAMSWRAESTLIWFWANWCRPQKWVTKGWKSGQIWEGRPSGRHSCKCSCEIISGRGCHPRVADMRCSWMQITHCTICTMPSLCTLHLHKHIAHYFAHSTEHIAARKQECTLCISAWILHFSHNANMNFTNIFSANATIATQNRRSPPYNATLSLWRREVIGCRRAHLHANKTQLFVCVGQWFVLFLGIWLALAHHCHSGCILALQSSWPTS